MADSRDHYQVLGLTRGADADEIRRAHRRLVHVLHPDRHHEATAAEQALADRRMREINEAYRTLRDPARRREYDSGLAITDHASGSSGATVSRDPHRARQGSPTGSTASRPPRRSSASSWTGPGSSAGAGGGAYWRSNGTSGAHVRSSGAAGADRSDGVAVTPAAAFLLRRGPILVLVVVVLGLFIVTAYVGGRGETREVRTPPPEVCARVIDGSEAVLIPCSMPNDGEVMAQVDAALDCPPEAPRYVTVGTEFYCIPEGEPPDADQ